MNNFLQDIVNDYNSKIKNGMHEVYYKQDLLGGIKLVLAVVGIAKIGMLIGGAAVAGIGSLLAFAVNNPQAAYKLGEVIVRNQDGIVKAITDAGNQLNKQYMNLPENEKKMVRTVVLLVAKGGLSWDDLR